MLLYGDAVAHINIARRVFDSRTPGLCSWEQLAAPAASAMMPFLISDRHGDRNRRLDAVDDLLCPERVRNIPSGAQRSECSIRRQA